jgi:hypothetical protein
LNAALPRVLTFDNGWVDEAPASLARAMTKLRGAHGRRERQRSEGAGHVAALPGAVNVPDGQRVIGWTSPAL